MDEPVAGQDDPGAAGPAKRHVPARTPALRACFPLANALCRHRWGVAFDRPEAQFTWCTRSSSTEQSILLAERNSEHARAGLGPAPVAHTEPAASATSPSQG